MNSWNSSEGYSPTEYPKDKNGMISRTGHGQQRNRLLSLLKQIGRMFVMCTRSDGKATRKKIRTLRCTGLSQEKCVHFYFLCVLIVCEHAYSSTFVAVRGLSTVRVQRVEFRSPVLGVSPLPAEPSPWTWPYPFTSTIYLHYKILCASLFSQVINA